MFLGALAGTLGSALTTGSSADQPLLLAQRGLAFVAGLLMVFIGLQFLGYFRSLHGTALGLGGQLAASSLQGLLKTPNPGAPLAFGVFNGFLPCPLVYAFLAHTARSEEHTSELQLLMRISYAVFCLKKKKIRREQY